MYVYIGTKLESEKSEKGQQTCDEASKLLKEDEDLIIIVKLGLQNEGRDVNKKNKNKNKNS